MPDENEFPEFDDISAGELQTERHGFAQNQMIACETCLRANPPTRLNCLYCGAKLPVTESSRPVLRQMEEWEQGYNVVLPPASAKEVSGAVLEEVADWLHLEHEALKSLAATECAMPLARAASAEDAAIIRKKLGTFGLRVEAVSDDALHTNIPSRRIRALELNDDMLVGRASADGETLRVEWPQIVLLVSGRLYEKRIEVEERQRRITRNEFVGARELVEDEAVLDIYAASDDVDADTFPAWRISAESFDYSCLGAAKSLLARDNFVTLISALHERAHAASYEERYHQVRHLLTRAWPLAEHTASQGLRRERPGKFNTEAVTIVSNELQFTRFSRLQYLFERRGRAQI